MKAEAKEAYWEDFKKVRARLRDKAMPSTWSEPSWEAFLYFGPTPRGNDLADFRWDGLSSATGPPSSRDAARERRVEDVVRRKRESNRGDENIPPVEAKKKCEATPVPSQTCTSIAIEKNNRIWSVVMLLKYGGKRPRDVH